MPLHPPKPLEVFVSYSSKDKKHKEELLKQLKVLAQQGVISAWHDGLLVPGQEWDKEIVEHLSSSRVILLLISPDFLTSDYVSNVELKISAERHRRREVCVIPVLVRNVNAWKSQPFGELTLGDFQAVPSGEKFIIEWNKRDKAWAEVAQGIQTTVAKLSASVPEYSNLEAGIRRNSRPDDDDQSVDELRSKLQTLRDLVEDELVDQSLRQEFQRRLLDKWVDKQ